MYVFSPKPATALQLNGTIAMLALLLLYASPLSSLLHVVRTRNSASILLPWTFAALGCSSTWFVYGVATRQIPVMVPHCLGMVLAVVQLFLRAVFPSRCGRSSLISPWDPRKRLFHRPQSLTFSKTLAPDHNVTQQGRRRGQRKRELGLGQRG